MQRYAHDNCGYDVFIGELGDFDVWICTRRAKPNERTVMLRYSNEDSAYRSLPFGLCASLESGTLSYALFGVARWMIESRNEPLPQFSEPTTPEAPHVHLYTNT